MIEHKTLDAIEDLLVDEVKKVIKKGELKDGNEAKALKEVLESIKFVHCLRDENVDDKGYSGYGGLGRMRYPGNYGGTVDFAGTYGHGYSGHSIHDRMIASLEGLYDQSKSQYEKDEITKMIGSIRSEMRG